jgi:NAD(P)-dependent dehydrogenase (short-subunit alcohol dehydrogenase family)
MSLKGKSIVVTGAFGALGRAVVAAVQAAGAEVAAMDRAPREKSPGFAAEVYIVGDVDLGAPAGVEAAFAAIGARFGSVDGLVNVAGGFHWEKIVGGTLETWDHMYTMNLRTALNATRAALPFLLKQGAARGSGRIVNITAAGAVSAGVGMGAYAASKAAVAKLTEALAMELKDSGITVNAIQPSTIDTAANRRDMPDADFSRWVTPQQIAEAIVFLLSDEARAITGAAIPVAGRV